MFGMNVCDEPLAHHTESFNYRWTVGVAEFQNWCSVFEIKVKPTIAEV